MRSREANGDHQHEPRNWFASSSLQPADRYERRSIKLTSTLPFGEWVSVFQNANLTTALLDRLTHHSHILTTKGGSYRTRARMASAKAAELPHGGGSKIRR